MKVFIADDHDILLDSLRNLLQEAGITVGGTSDTTYDLIGNDDLNRIDVVLLDLNMPGPPPQTVVSKLQENHPHLAIIVLTMYDEPYYVKQYLNLGVDGYLTKEVDSEHLLEALRSAHDQDPYLDPKLDVDSFEEETSPTASPEPILDELTDRQQEVLEQLALGHTNSEVAEKLNLSPRTVESHRAEIMRKLSFDSRADLTRFALDHDLLD